MRLEAGSQSIPNNIAYNLQQFLIPFQVGVPVHGTVNAQRADDLLQMNDGNADEGYFSPLLRVRVRFRNLESREISSITWGLPVSATCPVMPSPTW